MKKHLILFLLVASASGCSTYSMRQCQEFDWEQIGKKSALNGEGPEEGLEHYRVACEKEHGIRTKPELFQKGYQAGLQILCSPEGGKMLGASGNRYRGTCPKEMETPFLKGFESGRIEYLEARLSQLEDEVSRLKRDLSSRESEVSRLESQVSSLNFNNNCH